LLHVCFCYIRFSFFCTMPSDWLGWTSVKLTIFCVNWNIKPSLNPRTEWWVRKNISRQSGGRLPLFHLPNFPRYHIILLANVATTCPVLLHGGTSVRSITCNLSNAKSLPQRRRLLHMAVLIPFKRLTGMRRAPRKLIARISEAGTGCSCCSSTNGSTSSPSPGTSMVCDWSLIDEQGCPTDVHITVDYVTTTTTTKVKTNTDLYSASS